MEIENERNSIHLDDSSKSLFGVPEKYDYSKFKPDGWEIDNDLIEKFLNIAKKLNLSQQSLDLLLEIALEMSKKQCAIFEKSTSVDSKIAQYDKMFKDDLDLPDINSDKINSYMQVADSAYREFCSEKLKQFMKETGLNYHPEIIKMFHKIGELLKADGITYGGKPKWEEMTPAQILYGKRD